MGRRLLGAIAACGAVLTGPAALAQSDELVPQFRIDPDWPKVLPNAWTTGVIGGIHVADDDHVWIVNRPNSIIGTVENYALEGLGECCAPAPPVIEFDQAGNVVRAWGLTHQLVNATPDAANPYAPTTSKDVPVGKQESGPYPEHVWPMSEHAMFVDYKGNVWLASQNNPSQLVKFTKDGKLIKLFGEGKEATSSLDTKNFAGPTAVYVDPKTNEAFIADGYRNRRVIVVDADTGAFKRMWGAYGRQPKDPQVNGAFGVGRSLDQFTGTHCLAVTRDDLIYVCDRANSRIQVFKKDGTYINEVIVGTVNRPGAATQVGTAWAIAFSADKDQRFLYLGDGENKKVWILRRSDLKVLSTFGSGGRGAGQFQTLHSLAVDSKGNIYTGETLTGNRIQRFLFTGMGPASAKK